ncbi:MFS transporter [Streptomyces sp. NPDC057245]|uniref:MFS transporter n=1 Tax=Streptomyces TaxID=1883 RepID=UPI001C1E247A|nr:MFS transporter [Streptomyces sp. A108]MBU6534027.1 MFS transporter [Streptomyces sp. A108]
MTAPAVADPVRSGRKALSALILAVLSYSLVQTMLVPTLGILQTELDTSAAGASWAVLSSTLLASAVLTPLISRLGDSHGKRRILLATLVVHLLGNIGAAAAWNVGSLIAFRAVQGVSLALLPLSLGLIREVLPPQRVAFGLGLTSGLVGGAAGVGLLVGGLLVDHASWRWLFVAGGALVLLALFAVVRYVPASHRTATPAPLDLTGAALLGLTLVCVLLGLTEGPSWGWPSGPVLGLFTGGALFCVLFLWWEHRAPHPLVEPALLLGRPIVGAHIGAFLLGATQFVFYVLVPKLAQLPAGLPPESAHLVDHGFGASVTVAGLILVPGTLLGLPASSAVGRVESRLGPRAPLGLGLALSAVGGAAMALFHVREWQAVVAYGVIGTGFGLAMAALPQLVHDASPPHTIATANGINTVARTVGGAVGSQLATAVLASRTIPGTTLPADEGFALAFWMAAAMAAAGAIRALVTGRRSSRPAGAGKWLE